MLATSVLSPGEKTWFKNRTLLNYLPLAIFSHVTQQNQHIPVGKDLLKSAHSTTTALSVEQGDVGPLTSCGHLFTAHLVSWEEMVSRGPQRDGSPGSHTPPVNVRY